jgi:uncharacterized protein (TIGR02145 family)
LDFQVDLINNLINKVNMKRFFLFTVIAAMLISCGGKNSDNAKNARQINLTLSELQKMQQSKSAAEVHKFMVSKGWDLYESIVQTTNDRPYGSFARLPFECQKSEWTFEKMPNVGWAKGWLRWLNYKTIGNALSYDIRDKAHRDDIISELVKSGYKLVQGNGGENSVYRNDTYEVSFQTQFDASGADMMGVAGQNYWTFFIYNYKQVDAILHPGKTGEQAVSQSLSSTEDEGVVINGVKWATRNVDKPGTFAASPESAGMFYQWNRKMGWSNSEPLTDSDGGTSWNLEDTEGKKWAKANDPSPAGWRVPSEKELNKLLDTDKVTEEWTTLNSLKGSKFTDKKTGASLFLPAAGFIYNVRQGAYNQSCYHDKFGSYGIYWSNGRDPDNYKAINFQTGESKSSCTWWDGDPNRGHSLRPVAE